MLVAADAIGNHVDKIERISHGEFKVPVMLKTVVDDGGLFYSGPTHSQDFTSTFKEMVSFPVLEPMTAGEVLSAYNFAASSSQPVMIVEHKNSTKTSFLLSNSAIIQNHYCGVFDYLAM